MHHKFARWILNRKTHLLSALALALMVVVTGACGGARSPTDTFKAYYEAGTKKDVAGMKKYLSKGSIERMEVGAKGMGKSLDDALKEDAAVATKDGMPKFSDEKITGDTATVVITVAGQTGTMPFVKEGGEWKIAMDKLAETMMGAKVPAATSTPPPSAGPSVEEDEDHENSNH